MTVLLARSLSGSHWGDCTLAQREAEREREGAGWREGARDGAKERERAVCLGITSAKTPAKGEKAEGKKGNSCDERGHVHLI